MKLKIFLISLCLVTLLSVACGGKKEGTPVQAESGGQAGPVKIVTSFYPIYIMTLNITQGIPGVEVVNMTQSITGCLHDYQLAPSDMKKLQDAQIMVVNGAGMESFLDEVISQEQDLKIVDASKGIELLKNESDGEANPHLWVSVSGAAAQVKNIGAQLAAFDPDHAAGYQANTAAYLEKLENLGKEMHTALDPVKNRNIVTFHEAFPYFAKEFNLDIVAIIEREPGSEPSAGELSETIDTVKKAGVAALFAEPQYPAAAADTIARETGARVFTLDPCVTGPLEADSYLKTMEENLAVLQEALK
ncbi:metal ABC transporter substrate-binding protein [Candidatus Formimonas warabiya]|uniref:Zinc ABC transporter substrate-binding protein n=1 Tax=Formimonas warabiya TaxID=1761012 RepID=A0A3G1KYV1_FORW1|nr:metal ABC transporter substrate-binding protein [Candidatus Formimonas warabiya]ATW27652.1 zinc ABC transporter substrate-binding protein [Candidatus Formimonas warabiya]